ncbi:MAG: methylenetetrahydrofolate reductase [Lachnospiraceae bacterium]|nr:methylenetetrahydrofolate reductase [NAD(P)H] [Lachnospiraceae bacterium]MBQ6091811.1 methylenetetrahydrofolate reductase [NAD(P)H] [Lachnospiraceae bacterium]MBR5369645.1 methylenetetrahydrofolate reductase [NAD(P)H] [Lachnospiraceae bacterium]
MKIAEIYKQNKQSLSFEIFPPKKDSELESIDETLEVLCELKPDFISVTFGAGGGSNRNRTIEIAKNIKTRYGVEPVVHLTSLHYDKSEIDEFAKVLEAEGIENILALRGDRTPKIAEKDDFKHASDLIAYLSEKHDFCFLGACYPECHPESSDKVNDIKGLRRKVEAGASVLISQLFFENEKFFSFVESCRLAGIDVPIIPGIMPVINAAQIRRMLTICNASFPDRFNRIVGKYEDDKEALFDAGMSYALSQVIDLLAGDIPGIHLYTMNNPKVARRICEGIRNIVKKQN